MGKVIRLTESDLVRLIKRAINEIEGELNNPYWIKIKSTLVPMGFKFTQYNEKGGESQIYMDTNLPKTYQLGTLERGNISLFYPYTEIEGGELEKDYIRVLFNTQRPDIKKIDSILFAKYKNTIVDPGNQSQEGNYILKVADVNGVLAIVNDLSKLK